MPKPRKSDKERFREVLKSNRILRREVFRTQKKLKKIGEQIQKLKNHLGVVNAMSALISEF